MKEKHLIYLGVGVALTILFFVLSVGDSFNVYEQFYFDQAFNDQLYNLNMYSVIAAITILIAWSMAVLYYFVINSVKFDRWYHWLAMLAVTAVLVPVVCFCYIHSTLEAHNLTYMGQSLRFVLQNALFASALFIVASFAMRWWSTNCRHTPIPQ